MESSWTGAEVYSCHYDEGRITRRLDVDEVWATLAAKSIERYSEIEKESGVPFHTAKGYLAVGATSGPFLAKLKATASDMRLETQHFTPSELRSTWPYLDFCDPLRAGGKEAGLLEENAGLFEAATTGSGYISARSVFEISKLVIYS